MRISWRRASLLLPGVVLACSVHTNSDDGGTSETSSSRSSSGGGGCSGGSEDAFAGSNADGVRGPPKADAGLSHPTEPAPTGQGWKQVETDEGCGRMGLTWVLVDEACGDGEGNDDPNSFLAPMFRDGAIVDDHLFAIDATHLWTFDLASAVEGSRSSLLTGLGTPLAVGTRGHELVLAAGAEGLVMVDTTNPAAPTRSRSIELAGKAYDVRVDADKAYVALGRAGIAEVDLAGPGPSVTHSWAIGGFSAGVTTRGNYAYVAACSTFKVVDLSNGQVVSQAWVPNAVVNERLVAPAKKVALVGDVAFVAAGRYGAVAVDVSNPQKPTVLGNCTVENAPSFYASGVRASGDKLYVAAGEWGILPIDVGNAKSACAKMTMQAQAEAPAPTCSSKPPWEEVPWETIWQAPPPAKDPIQTLPVGDRVYAFGDARRVGVRAVDVRNALDSTLPIVRRFDEPRALLGIAATPARVVTVGPRGGVFAVGSNGALTRTPTLADAALRGGTAVTMLADGRWAALGENRLDVEGNAAPIALTAGDALTAVSGSRIAVASRNLELIDVDTGLREKTSLVDIAHLPLSVAADASGVYYAAPEWTQAARLTGAINGKIEAHGIFDKDDIMDTGLWRTRLPRRHLLTTPRGLVEVAGVGAAAGISLHTGTNVVKTSLPAMTYAAAATDGSHVYLAGIDRGLYRSYVVSIDVAGAQPEVLDVESFTGAASGIAVAGGKVFVSDADGAIRTYVVSPTGIAAFRASTEVAP